MKIIISPAKKMNVKDDSLEISGLPRYMEEAEGLKRYIRGLSYEDAKAVWKCNDKIAALNYERFLHMNLEERLTPAILSYEGIQYQYMAPDVFSQKQLDYVQKHLFILSGFYGALLPLEGIVPYRLEMQSKVDICMENDHFRDLYRFWGSRIYRRVTEEDHVIVNLASKEYSKAVEAYLEPEDVFINCIFGCMEQDKKGDYKVKVKGTEAKMARGEMVRFMAEREIEDPKEIRKFDRLGYAFSEERSDDRNYVFLLKNQKPETAEIE
ncbi:peroxide stress protein YaaA [Clostridium sp. chh4-2]|uniref:peroxide stress protein YaaA n=1 Tax=Clostridium sp. chh4-2 TaxID=2067550 RepID=UPI000CCFA24D|nr:peroxide stress protein YaaA [Clostridium sp. chh4-2]PNV63485.1 peroxide stress protein YaaA [Clostridium sp. chh4-2]